MFTDSILRLALGGALIAALFSSPVKANEILFAYNLIDHNRDAQVSFDEFYIYMMHENTREMQAEFIGADKNNDKQINFEEAAVFEVSYEEFQHADQDQNAGVDLPEFLQAYVQYTFKEADRNRNKIVELSEFKDLAEHDHDCD